MSTEDDCYTKPDPCPACTPSFQAKCKVWIYASAYKYDGCCYQSCDACGCPKVVIWMRRVDALALVKACCARFVDDDEEVECTPCGSCCQRENTLKQAA